MAYFGSSRRSSFSRALDEDWVDKLNRFWTVLLLATCSVGAFLARFVTEPVRCTTPPEFTGQMNAYTDKACFLEEHFVDSNKESFDLRNTEHTSFHLWIPLVLFLQAVCFKAPNVIWKFGKKPFSINLNHTVPILEDAQVADPEKRHILISDTAQLINSFLQNNRFILGVLYLGVKITYCVNLCGQLIFLTVYFHQELAMEAGSKFGLNVSSYQSPMLYKHVLCAMRIRKFQNIQTFTLQCAVPIAEIYEKIFVFLWYWVFLLTIVTICSSIVWSGYLFLPFFRDQRISSHIRAFNGQSGAADDKGQMTRFISGFLGIDGVFLLSMICCNSNDLIAADLTNHLFTIFQKQKRPAAYGQTAANETLDGQPMDAEAGPADTDVAAGYAECMESIPLDTIEVSTELEPPSSTGGDGEKRQLADAYDDSSPVV